MALVDYRLCDVCHGKAFYDARLNYEDAGAQVAVRYAGEVSWYRLDDLGDWAVLCKDCAKTHRTEIVKIEVRGEGRRDGTNMDRNDAG